MTGPSIGISRPAVDRAPVPEYKKMHTGKSSRLSQSQCLTLGGIENPKPRLLPDGRVPPICWTSALEGLRVMVTSISSILLTLTRPGGNAVVKMTSSRVGSPPWGVGDGKPPSKDDRADVVFTRTKSVSINYFESVRSRIGLQSTEMLMHILPVSESILQCESKRLRSHEARGCVDNDSVGGLVSTVYIPSMGSLEVGLNQREVLTHGHIEVMLISVRVHRQELQVDRIRMNQVARSPTAPIKLLSIIDIHISSIRDLSTPVLSSVISTFPGGLEILRRNRSDSTPGKFKVYGKSEVSMEYLST